MTLRRLLLHNLCFHWRGNLAVGLGVAVGTAVLTGALLVGDSLRGSLRERSRQRLGWIEQALVAGRFFREDLAAELAAARAVEGAAPAILLQGAASTSGRRAGRVTILGVDDRFWLDGLDPRSFLFSRRGQAGSASPLAAGVDPRPGGDSNFWQSSDREVLLGDELARELQVRPGDQVVFHLQKSSAIHRESLFGRRDSSEVLARLTLTVRTVLASSHFGSRFSLAPTVATPRNAFVPLRVLQDAVGQPERVNAILARGDRSALEQALGKHLTLDDWGLVLHDPESRTERLMSRLGRRRGAGQLTQAQWRDLVPRSLADRADPQSKVLKREAVLDYYRQRNYLSLESRQLLLERAVEEAGLRAAEKSNLISAPTLVYMANLLAEGEANISYSAVAALDPKLPPPLGPFLPPGVNDLQDEEIILAGWEGSPLPGKAGDEVKLGYFEPGEPGQLEEKTVSFKLRGVLPLRGVADDAELTPEVAGITDQPLKEKWDPPFPYNARLTRQAENDYWEHYRTTPLAYVTLKKGQQLWSSRFGRLTSIRLAPRDGPLSPEAAATFRKHLLEGLRPEQAGFVFDDVRQRGLDASSGGVDFSILFLGFSVFLILAALLLVGLLVRLNLDRRAGELGLLLATGFRVRTVRGLLLAEAAVLALLGGLAGSVAAAAYGWGLLEFLNAHWPGALDRSLLGLHVSFASLAAGYLGSVAVGMATIVWAVRQLGRMPPTALLAGQTAEVETASAARRAHTSRWVAAGSTLVGIGLIAAGGLVKNLEMQAGTFFGGGALLLLAGLAFTWTILGREAIPGGQGPRRAAPSMSASARQEPGPDSPVVTLRNNNRWRVSALGVRNAGRQPTRSLLTAGLLAAAAFLIVAVESFRREPARDFLEQSGGSGGFALLAESDTPIFQDLNGGPGRQEILSALQSHYQDQAGTTAEEAQQRVETIDKEVLSTIRITGLRLRAGDDSSCLNLYQPGRPRLLGVPDTLIQRGGFHFAALPGDATPEERAKPWRLLLRTDPEGAVPVFGEQNSVTWMLKKGLGDVVELAGEQLLPSPLAGEGKGGGAGSIKLRIVGLLKDSVFQSELLMAEANFLRLYPGQEGQSFFLIEAPAAKQAEAEDVLEIALSNRGFDATPSVDRLAGYLAVENTYLSTFQALGGLGLVLGSLGLAVVLLRSVWERRGELALLRALGFRRRALGEMVLAENAFLLGLGLLVGTAAAFVSVAPHLLTGQGHVPWLRLLVLLGLVLLAGLSAGGLAMRATLRAPLLPALRRE